MSRGEGQNERREAHEDRVAEEIVEEALSSYRGVLPEALCEALRDYLLDAFILDPDARRLLRRILPDPQREVSGDASDGAETDDLERGGTA